jgi:hypothetical protein
MPAVDGMVVWEDEELKGAVFAATMEVGLVVPQAKDVDGSALDDLDPAGNAGPLKLAPPMCVVHGISLPPSVWPARD